MRILILFLILSLSVFTGTAATNKNSSTVFKHRVEKNVNVPKVEINSGFTFDELVQLSQTAEPKDILKAKLDEHLSMVYILNRNNDYSLDKPYLRVAHWNINRGFHIAEVIEILTNPRGYERKNIANVRPRNRKNFKEELNAFSTADIICLNEADIGMPRTKYKNIVYELSDSLNWNFVYATEFIELGPLFQKEKVDSALYKGLHGNVIISKFPIVSAHVIRLPNKYDWYRNEIIKHESPVEHLRKIGSLGVFSHRLFHHEVRHGTRNAIIADIKLPNDKIVTVVSSHFEDRAYPDERLKQFKYVLNHIKSKKTPIIFAGDFNTSTTDTKPTSMRKEVVKRIRDPHFIARVTATSFIPGIPILPGFAAIAFSKLLQYKDPFFPSIPVIFPNHERKFYACLKDFKFDDGNKFDLSGDKKRSSNGRRGLLANSNQRHWKGFKSTYKLKKPRIIAYFKLDWFFVKPLGKYFTPFNGRTLKSLNYSIKEHISDHNPITVDIRF